VLKTIQLEKNIHIYNVSLLKRTNIGGPVVFVITDFDCNTHHKERFREIVTMLDKSVVKYFLNCIQNKTLYF